MTRDEFHKMCRLGHHNFQMKRIALITLVHQTYNLEGVSVDGPVSFEGVRQFQMNNERHLALNLFGLTKLKDKQYSVFPFCISSANFSGVKTINLVVTKQIKKGSDETTGKRNSYHIV